MAAVTLPAWGTGHEVAEATIANLALARIGADPIKDTGEETPSARQAKAVFGATRDELLRDYEFNFAQRNIRLPLKTFAGKGSWAYAYDLPSSIKVLKLLDVGNNKSNLMEYYDNTVVTDVQSQSAGTQLTEVTMEHADETVTVSSVADLADGKPVTVVSGTLPTGITAGTTYWVRDLVASTKKFKLAATPGGAVVLMSVQDGSSIVLDIPANLEARVVTQVEDPSLWDSLFKDALVLRIGSKLAVPLVKRADLAQFLQGEFAAIFNLAKVASSKERQIDESEAQWTDRARGK